MQEVWVGSLSWEDPLEEDMATHSSIHARENPTDKGTWWATVHEAAEQSDTTEHAALLLSLPLGLLRHSTASNPQTSTQSIS